MDDFTPATSYTHTHTIAALFTDADQAVNAVEALRNEGFGDTSVRVTHNPADIDTDASDRDPGFWDKLLSWFEGEDKETELYREGIRRGGSLVTVQTTEDLAGKAINILDFYAPADLDEHARQWQSEGWRARDVQANEFGANEFGAEALATGDLYDRRDDTLGNPRVRGFVRSRRDTGALG